MNYLEKSKEKVLLFLDNFDALFDNPYIDSEYNLNFFNNLNSIRNNTKLSLSLLFVTKEHYNNSVIFINGKTFTSYLNLEVRFIPNLGHEQIEKEIDSWTIPIISNEKRFIVDKIHDHSMPYSLLKFLESKISSYIGVKNTTCIEGIERFNLRIVNIWVKEFNSNQSKSFKEKMTLIINKIPVYFKILFRF